MSLDVVVVASLVAGAAVVVVVVVAAVNRAYKHRPQGRSSPNPRARRSLAPRATRPLRETAPRSAGVGGVVVADEEVGAGSLAIRQAGSPAHRQADKRAVRKSDYSSFSIAATSGAMISLDIPNLAPTAENSSGSGFEPPRRSPDLYFATASRWFSRDCFQTESAPSWAMPYST